MARILVNKRRFTARKGQTLLEALLSVNTKLASLCGGRGLCGKCRIIVEKGKAYVNKSTSSEGYLLSNEEREKGYRLACLARITEDGVINIAIPRQSLIGHQRLLTTGRIFQVKIDPVFKKIFVKLDPPTLKDIRSDRDRIVDSINAKSPLRIRALDYNVLRQLPSILRSSSWKVTFGIWDNEEIISVQEGNTENRALGFAIDIGTTKLAGYLVDLNSGELVASTSSVNPQIPFGEDVISRITFVGEDRTNLRRLHESIVDETNRLIDEACNNAKLRSSDIYEMTVAGNTAMQQIFLNITPIYLAKSPFTTVTSKGLDVKAEKVGIRINENGYVHVLPQIAGFVGGDAVADIVATKLNRSSKISLLIDVGTNAELILGNRKELLACSCASGPAFEGAHIKHGIRAEEGAVEKIWVDPETKDVSYQTIGDVKPIGICGSAIVDAVSEMLINGLIDTHGRIRNELNHKRIRKSGTSYEFIIAHADETSVKEDIVVTQADIREIQLAKAAIYAGTSVLMEHMKLQRDDVEKMFLAGAFGTYVDPQSARNIGMIPDIPLDRIEFVGNTSGSGARLTLLSKEIRAETENIARKVKYIELAADPRFRKRYVSAMSLPHENASEFPSVKEMLSKADNLN